MPLKHAHRPGRLGPGHCRDCARESDLLDHRHARWALWSSGVGIVLAVVALLTG